MRFQSNLFTTTRLTQPIDAKPKKHNVSISPSRIKPKVCTNGSNGDTKQTTLSKLRVDLNSVAGAGPAGLGRALMNGLARDVQTQSALVELVCPLKSGPVREG